MATRRVADERIDGWLDAVASGPAEPSGGAFAALAAATGAALIEAVVRRTLRRSDDEEPLMRIADEAAAARRVFLAFADRDEEAFRTTLEAYRLPHGDEAGARRLRELQEALEGSIDVQLDLARRATYLLGLAEQATRDGDPNAAAHGVAAAAGLHAATVAAVANAEADAFAILDAERRSDLVAACAALRERAGALLADVQATFRERAVG